MIRIGNPYSTYLVAVGPEDEGGLLEAVVDLAGQVEHAPHVDKHLAVAQDPRRWHCREKCCHSFYYNRKRVGEASLTVRI